MDKGKSEMLNDGIKKITNSRYTDYSYNAISDKEMEELKHLYPSLRKGLKDAKEGKYNIIVG